MKRIAASLLATLLLLIPLSARPLALGDIQLRSNLNAPLDARIPLLSATAADIDSIRVALASHEQFERAGVDRPFVLSGLRFEVVTDKGSPYIHVTTQGPVSEPFLNFLLDVDWSKGRAVREYTVLLDPPIYGAAVRRTAEAAVQTVPRNPAPRVAQVAPRQAAPRPAATPAPTPRPASAPASGPTSPPVTSQASSRPAPRAPVPTSQPGTYQVRNNDTLWSLAARFRPRGATIQQTMLAMLERNPEAFENGNVNRLNAGAVLNIPATVDTDQISRTRALAEVKRQHAAWSDYRRSIGSSVPKTPIEVASGGAADAPAGAGGSSADAGRLKIASGGDASGGVGTSQSDSPNVSSLRSELSLVQEEVDRAKRENEELGNKLADAESVIEELRRLVSVQSDEMAALQRQLSGAATVADSAGQAVTGDTPTTAGSGDGSSDGQAGEAGQVGTPTDAMTADAGSTTSDAPADSPADTVADASGADSPGTDSPGTDSSGADSSGADAAETDSSRAMLDTQGAAGDAASGTPMALAGDSTTGDTTSVNTAGGDAGANADAQAPTDAMATSDGSGTASPVMADNSASTDSTTPPVPMPSPTAQPEGFMGKLKAQLDQLPGGAAGILGGSGALLVIVMLIVWLLRRRSTDAEDEEFAMPMSADEMGAPADLADTVADPDAGLAGDTVSEGDETAAAFAGETHHIANAPSTDDDDDD
ncbi:MAG: FimV/HubP family polar landmark protein, partial [Pseudomonadota bacterium]